MSAGAGERSPAPPSWARVSHGAGVCYNRWVQRWNEVEGHEEGHSSGIPAGDRDLRLRQHIRHRLNPVGHPRGDLLEVPPVLHRAAEVHRRGRARAEVRQEVRAQGVLSARSVLAVWLLLALGLGLGSPPGAAAQAPAFEAWRLHETPHFQFYVLPGTPGARDIAQISADLELVYAEVIAPLGLPPTHLVYPLYPSLERFGQDWWHFATLGYGDVVHAWGTIYTGDNRALNAYTLTRAVISDAFPRAIPLLRWGLGEALGDRAAGVDPYAHLTAAAPEGRPAVTAILAPTDFGDRLPMSYPTAVSFMGFLLERYGLPRTAAFTERVTFRYFDFADLFLAHFGESLGEVESAWQARVAAAEARAPVDAGLYAEATRFVYRVTLAGNPGRRMLLPDGPVVVSEALAAVDPLRRLNLAAVRGHMERARRASERAARSERRTERGLRAIVYLMVLTPILFAVGWLLWPAIRARRAAGGRRPRHG